MKTLRIMLLTSALLFVGSLSPAAHASTTPRVKIDQDRLARLDPADQQRVLCIADRFEAIAQLDRSQLSAAERKALRNEVRDLRQEAQAINAAAGGTVLYISTGLLIIILLLIILL